MLFVWLPIVFSLAGLAFAAYLFWGLKKQKVDDGRAQIVANYIKNGARTFLFKEFRILAIFVVIVALLLWLAPGISWIIALSFIIGAIFSALAGFLGMTVATTANVRTALKCQNSQRQGLITSFSAGLSISLVVVSLGLLGLALIYLIFSDISILYGFALGASLAALFARVGGGIFTKAADMGADLVGKVENDIPEDDLRNPAVIADNVGDNVGDVAGMSADLFESYVSSMMVAMVFGVTFLPLFGSIAITLPLLLGGVGILLAISGKYLINILKGDSRRSLSIGVWLINLAMAIISFFLVKYLVGDLSVFWALLVGLAAGVAIGLSTEYFTSSKNRPTQMVAEASETGSATNVIAGLSVGLFSAVIPVVAVIIAIYLSYYFSGFYGLAMAAVGMLSTLGITLATDTFGPIVDNAAGIAEMSGMGSEVRERAENLDAVGNTTAAVGKGFAIGSAALTALLLLIVFGKSVGLETVNLLSVKVIIGLFIGGLLPFVFIAWLIRSVGKAASKMVREVRRQFEEIGGILSGQTEPDYNRCIDVSTDSALWQMIVPSILAIVVPILVGLFLGAGSLAAMLIATIVAGFSLAVFLANAGSTWDNAKKYIEADHFGGVGSYAHKASIVGDMVGDPLKDTAGPALNILIKLMAIVSLVIVPLLLL